MKTKNKITQENTETTGLQESTILADDKASRNVPANADPVQNSQKIWGKIKDLKINVFGFEENVEKYFTFFPLTGKECYLTCKVSAAFPALESCLSPSFTVEKSDKYYIVKEA